MKLLLPFWLVFLAALSGLPAMGRASDRAFPLIISQPQTAAGPVSGLPTPATAGRTQQQDRNPPTGSSSRPNLRFDRLSATDGLSYSFTTSILQDQQGFMWFGTRYGLNQFDGFDFTVHILGTSGDVLFANYMRNLYEDRTGDLWISNLVDLVRRDRETGEFVHYVPDAANPKSLGPGQIYPIAEDAAGNLWVGTSRGPEPLRSCDGHLHPIPAGHIGAQFPARPARRRLAWHGRIWAVALRGRLARPGGTAEVPA